MTISATDATTSCPTTSERKHAATTFWESSTMSPTDSATVNPTTNTASTANRESETISTLDSSTSEPIRPTTTGSLTTQEATTTSTTASSTLIPTTKTSTTNQESETISTLDTTALEPITESPTIRATASTIDSTILNPNTTKLVSTTQNAAATLSTADSTIMTIPTPSSTTTRTTALETTKSTTMTTDSTTSSVPTTTQSTVKIFVTDADINNKIFVADLQAGRDDFVFTAIRSTLEPRYITYDCVDHKIYWTDKGRKRVYRADVDGGNRETITRQSDDELLGIAIAETSRNLYIANEGSKKITSLSIGGGNSFPREETEFVKDLDEEVYCLEVDEEQGYLYWSQKYDIQRKQLDSSGSIETVFHDGDLSEIYGLSIDLSRDPRRVFFCNFGKERTFYFDVNTAGNAGGTELTNHLQVTGSSDGGTKLRDISFFNGVLYWAKEDNPSSIAVMTNYEHSIRSYKIYQTSQIGKPHQLIIFTLDE